MLTIAHNNRVRTGLAITRTAVLALLLSIFSLTASPVLRLGLEANAGPQSFVSVSNVEVNTAVFGELSRDYKCPYRLSGGIRLASFTHGDLGYLIVAPELNAYYFMSITKKIGATAGLGFGYFVSNAYEVESGAYGRVSASLIYKPLPIIDLRLSAYSMPFKTPSHEEFSNYGLGVGISYMFGFPDDDRDWIADDADTCPNTPKGARVDEWGCPLDSDGDGVYDGFDKCPNTPFRALVDSTGCPTDSDGDGVYDGIDQCPDTPSHINVDSTGCPKDSDADGIPDYLDECENTPKGAVVDEKGCPRDSDEDGVYDGIDECPKTPSGFIVDERGCPFVKPVDSETISDAYDNGLNLKAPAVQKLENLAERLRAHQYRNVEIAVHTDSEGSDTYNINRSMRVAEKVKEFLMTKGVPPEIITLKGYGERYPIASDATAEGKSKNRRIVFEHIE